MYLNMNMMIINEYFPYVILPAEFLSENQYDCIGIEAAVCIGPVVL